MLTTLTLAALEFGQGLTVAAFQGLEVIRKDISRTARKRDQARKMAASVQRDLDSITTK